MIGILDILLWISLFKNWWILFTKWSSSENCTNKIIKMFLYTETFSLKNHTFGLIIETHCLLTYLEIFIRFIFTNFIKKFYFGVYELFLVSVCYGSWPNESEKTGMPFTSQVFRNLPFEPRLAEVLHEWKDIIYQIRLIITIESHRLIGPGSVAKFLSDSLIKC